MKTSFRIIIVKILIIKVNVIKEQRIKPHIITQNVIHLLFQRKHLCRDLCMFDIIVPYIDSNTSSTSLPLTTVSAFEAKTRFNILFHRHFLNLSQIYTHSI